MIDINAVLLYNYIVIVKMGEIYVLIEKKVDIVIWKK